MLNLPTQNSIVGPNLGRYQLFCFQIPPHNAVRESPLYFLREAWLECFTCREAWSMIFLNRDLWSNLNFAWTWTQFFIQTWSVNASLNHVWFVNRPFYVNFLRESWLPWFSVNVKERKYSILVTREMGKILTWMRFEGWYRRPSSETILAPVFLWTSERRISPKGLKRSLGVVVFMNN